MLDQDLLQRITANPEIFSGKPIIRGFSGKASKLRNNLHRVRKIIVLRILGLVFSLLIFCLPLAAKALPVVVDFEMLTDGDVLTNQLTGLTFTNALVQSAGLST